MAETAGASVDGLGTRGWGQDGGSSKRTNKQREADCLMDKLVRAPTHPPSKVLRNLLMAWCHADMP